jgi:hypothetical protein
MLIADVPREFCRQRCAAWIERKNSIGWCGHGYSRDLNPDQVCAWPDTEIQAWLKEQAQKAKHKGW